MPVLLHRTDEPPSIKIMIEPEFPSNCRRAAHVFMFDQEQGRAIGAEGANV
jgi:hypothetical protein